MSEEEKDDAVAQVAGVLQQYRANHPAAQIDVRRASPVSIHVRVIDPDFKPLDLVDREDVIWPILEQLHEEIRADITMVILLAPDEVARSWANMAFEEPVPSDW